MENKKDITGTLNENHEIAADEEKSNNINNMLGDGPSDAPTLNAENIDSNMISMIHYHLNKLFGLGSQMFVMEYPGRNLNKLDYAYPIEDYNSSSLTKPYSVGENEFRLCDNMFDLYPIVQGPNGNKLSNVYNSVINNYTPKLDNIKDFIVDKMEMRMFLMKKITDEIDGETITCTRLEFCQRLYHRYLEKKYAWDEEKIEKQSEYTLKKELDEYAKWLSTTAWTKDHELETLFNDAIIRGFYHEIMTILGFIDIASPAERLSNAKSNRRSSVRRSLDGSLDILPVQFQPSNWFRSLTPNFSPKDLTLGREYLQMEYKSKTQLLSSLKSELRVLINNSVGDDSVNNLKKETEKLRTDLNEAEKTAFKGYTDAQTKAIKLAFEIASKGDIVSFISGGKANVTASLSKLLQSDSYAELFGLAKDALTTMINSMYDLYEQHLDYFKSYNDLIEAELQLASAQSGSFKDQIEILSERIKLITNEVEELAVIITSDAVNNDEAVPNANNDKLILPISKYDEDTEFSDIVFSSNEYSDFSKREQNSVYGTLAGKIGNLFFNSSTGLDYSASNTDFVKKMYNSGIQIGMRVTKVTIERGGWFDPGIIDLSSAYMRVQDKILTGAGLNAKQVMEAYNATDSADNMAVDKLLQDKEGRRCIFPAFPQAFIIAKDIVIKAHISEFNEEEYEEFRKVTTSTTTSLFGIKVSGGFTNQSFMGFESSDGKEGTFIMRIPGPQILGWFMELTGKDMSSQYVSLSGSKYFEDIMKKLKEYRKQFDDNNNKPDYYEVED